MIKSWLDETFPTMIEEERVRRANLMDMSLIEERKEDSIKNILEINNIVRMSLIEMQFIKKVRQVLFVSISGRGVICFIISSIIPFYNCFTIVYSIIIFTGAYECFVCHGRTHGIK